MSTFSSMLNYTPGHTIPSYEIVERDRYKTGWSICDVPLFVRIDHPNRQTYKANNGAKMVQKNTTGKPRAKPMLFWIDGVIHEVDSATQAISILQVTLSKKARNAIASQGWYRLTNGIVVWYKQIGEPPECVPRPLVYART